MVQVVIKGKHGTASKEEIRAMIQASSSVLEMGKLALRSGDQTITVEFVTMESLGPNEVTKSGGCWGRASASTGSFKVAVEVPASELFTVVIHEVIHLYLQTSEKACSTLTARYKSDISIIYQVLVINVYQRAAFLAHTRKGMAYDPKGLDEYNKEQWAKKGMENAGEKHRKNRV